MKRALVALPALVVVAACSSAPPTPQRYSGDAIPNPNIPRTGPSLAGSTGSSAARSAPAPVATAPRTAPAPAPSYRSTPVPTYPPPAPVVVRPTPAPAPAPVDPYRTPQAPPTGPAAPSPYYPTAPAPAQPAPPPPVTAHAPLPTAPSSFQWARSLSEAQSLARAQGKLIMIEAGRDACGNCQKLRNKTIPEVTSQLGAMCIGYYDDVDRDPGSQAFRLLYANLPGAAVLPLVGFVTPDLRWVHGFNGGRDTTRFLGELQTARSKYQQGGSLETGTRFLDTAALPPLPEGPDLELADASAELGEGPMDAPAVAEADMLPEDALMAPADGTEWARETLREAARALAARDVDTARALCAQVAGRRTGTPEAREAQKAEVAIYNLRRVDRPEADEADRARARADLNGTVWATLFA